MAGDSPYGNISYLKNGEKRSPQQGSETRKIFGNYVGWGGESFASGSTRLNERPRIAWKES